MRRLLRLSENSFGKYKFTLQDELELEQQKINWYREKNKNKPISNTDEPLKY